VRPGIIIAAFFFFASAASANSITVDPSIATAGAIAPGSIPQEDLKPHLWTIQPSVGYFTGSPAFDGSGATVSIHGWGGTGEAEYALNEHMGISFAGIVYSGSGTFTPGASEPGAISGSASVNGWLASATLVLDAFSGNGFRMPFFFGLNYEHLSSSTPSSPTITAMSLNSPGYTLGFSPRFNVGFLRLEPFLVSTTPTRKGNVACSVDVIAGACGAEDVQMLPVLGVNVIFRPWNLSFYVNLSSFLLGTGVSYYSVGHQFSF
jgi:hypothetical protein